MSVLEHKSYAPARLGFASITVSDSRTAADDQSGRRIAERVKAAGHELVDAAIVRDEIPAIRAAARRALILPGVDVLIVTGGTGFSPRDVTIEALSPLLERPIDGFGELFRMLSFAEIGPAAMLSRAVAGTSHGRLVVTMPGSSNAVRLAMTQLVLPELGHLVHEIGK